MGLFGASNPFEVDVEKATDEKNTSENWSAIMDICDKVGQSKTGPKDCLRSIMQRLSSKNPRIALQAITLLDACISNCGKSFHLEVASRETVGTLREIITSKGHDAVAEKLFNSLRQWSEGDFKTDASLDLIPSLYRKLRSDGLDFSDSEANVKQEYSKQKENAAKEEDDILKAIARSLEDQDKHKQTGNTSLYPSFSAAAPVSQAPRTQRKVRALYDFEAVEDNELTFHTGDLITVTDDSDVNWWRGRGDRGEGLFPANFVTADLSATSESTERKGVTFNEEVRVQTVEEPEEVTINESKLDECLELLQNADPSGEQRPDPPQMQQLEEHCKAMGPLIDQELDKVDRAHAAMMEVNIQVADAVRLYNELMRQTPASFPAMPQGGPPMSLQQPASMPPSFPSMSMMPPANPGQPPHFTQPIAEQVGVASIPPQASMPPQASLPPQASMPPPASVTPHASMPPQPSLAPQVSMPASLSQQYQQYDSIQSIQSIPAAVSLPYPGAGAPVAAVPQYGSFQHQQAIPVMPQQYAPLPVASQQPLL